MLLRLRSQTIASLTRFFGDRDFVQTHTPIITSSDCEGAGEVFTVAANASKTGASGTLERDYYFRSPKYLTVSAQLHLEALAQSIPKVWTLSPTFRAEKSDTARHLSEFYMLEAEISFIQGLDDVMGVVEDMLRALTVDLQGSKLGSELIELRSSAKHREETDSGVSGQKLTERWQGMISGPWPRITHIEAVERLQAAVEQGRITFEDAPDVGSALQAEHERFLAEDVGKGSPIFVTDYPWNVKPFYMAPSASAETDMEQHRTVSCFDLLVPDLCEIAGGSRREHRLKELCDAMRRQNINPEGLQWYLDLRRYGSVPHGGFGLGFDRLLCYLAGVANIREAVTFPRWYGRCDC